MPVGYIYIVTTAERHYMQKSFWDVPTEFERRIYFGPCKKHMRPKMKRGDYVIGISPHQPAPRRILFITRITERITFAQAHERFPRLRGDACPKGPIHVRPRLVKKPRLPFPKCDYEHIPGADHPEDWCRDLATRELDAFFVGAQGRNWFGRWLGPEGPEVDCEIVEFLRRCSVYGKTLRGRASAATKSHPVVHKGPNGGLQFTGLHLETNQPEALVALCEQRVKDISVAGQAGGDDKVEEFLFGSRGH